MNLRIIETILRRHNNLPADFAFSEWNSQKKRPSDPDFVELSGAVYPRKPDGKPNFKKDGKEPRTFFVYAHEYEGMLRAWKELGGKCEECADERSRPTRRAGQPGLFG